MQCPPALVVHGFDQACAALALGRPVTLLSGVGAGIYGGVGWWRGLIDAARAVHPGTTMTDILDCADAPGAAMAALRRGQATLRLDPACPAFAAVAGVAAACGARLLVQRPSALDLGQHDSDERGASRRLEIWLATDDSRLALR